MQFSNEAFFIAANNRGYSRRARARSRLVRHPICISRAPFRDSHSAIQPVYVGTMFPKSSDREKEGEPGVRIGRYL